MNEQLQRRARNLFVIASAIIVYLLAGADLDQLSALGLRAPSAYPEVFRWAAVLAFFWFWWRYWVGWRASGAKTHFDQTFWAEAAQTDEFRDGFVRRTEFLGQCETGAYVRPRDP